MSHRPPEKPDEPVIQWRTSGGLLANDDQTPDLEIRADGRVTVGERFGGGAEIHAEIPPDQVQQLLQMILDEHDFFALDSAQIHERVEAERRRRTAAAASSDAATRDVPSGPPFVDAGVTHIAVAADGRRHDVSVQGLFAAAREYPEVPGVTAMREIETVLLGLAEELAGSGS